MWNIKIQQTNKSNNKKRSRLTDKEHKLVITSEVGAILVWGGWAVQTILFVVVFYCFTIHGED